MLVVCFGGGVFFLVDIYVVPSAMTGLLETAYVEYGRVPLFPT